MHSNFTHVSPHVVQANCTACGQPIVVDTQSPTPDELRALASSICPTCQRDADEFARDGDENAPDSGGEA